MARSLKLAINRLRESRNLDHQTLERFVERHEFPVVEGTSTTFVAWQQHADEVDAVAVFAPYLGSRRLSREIRDAGGLARWTPDPPATITKKNYQRQLWSWLHRVTSGAAKGPTLYVGYGDDDRLARQDALLAAALPEANVFHAQGGHDWPVWRELLQQFLQRSQFTTRCAPLQPNVQMPCWSATRISLSRKARPFGRSKPPA